VGRAVKVVRVSHDQVDAEPEWLSAATSLIGPVTLPALLRTVREVMEH
jgi:hypothetical protein